MKKYIFIILSIIIISCKKEPEDTPPSITVISPNDNSVYNIPDTINITAIIADENLTSCSIELTDANYIPCCSKETIEANKDEIQIDINYYINDIHLKSGQYYVHLQALDGTNTTNTYIPIKINEADKEKLFYLTITKSGNYLKFYKTDLLYQTTYLFSCNSDYLGSGVSNNNQYFYTSGKCNGDLVVYDLTTFEKLWGITCIKNPPFVYFSATDIFNGKIYLGFKEGKYCKYNYYGNTELSVTDYVNSYYPTYFHLLGEYLICEETSPTGQTRILKIRYEPSGTDLNWTYTYETTVSVLNKNSGEMFHLTNDNTGQGHLYLFYISSCNENELHDLPPGKIISAIKIGNEILIGQTNGVIRYDITTNSVWEWLNGTIANSIKYEELDGRIFITENNEIKEYASLNSITPANTIIFDDTIAGFHIIYNKD